MDERRTTGTESRRRTAGSTGDTEKKRTVREGEGAPRRRPGDRAGSTGTARRRPIDNTGSAGTVRRRPIDNTGDTGEVRRRPSGITEGTGEVRRRPSGITEGTGAVRRRPSEKPESAGTVRRRPIDNTGNTDAVRRRPSGITEGTGEVRRRPAETEDRVRREGAQGQRSARNTKRKKKKRGISPVILLFLVFLVIAAVAAGSMLWKKYGPTKEKYDLNKYFGVESDEQLGMTINNEVTDAQAMRVDGNVYVSYEVVRDYLNSRFYWDPNENILLYTLPRAMVRVDVGSKEYTISKETKSEDYVILKTDGSTAYIALDFVQQYTNLEYKVYEEPNPARVMIVSEFGSVQTAVVKRDTQVRLRGGVKSPVLAEVKKGAKVTVIEEIGDWKKVRTEDGVIGYAKISALRKQKTETTSREFKEEEFTNIAKDKKINLAWHQVTNKAANSTVLETIARTKGLTTISPTWFSVADNSGNLNSIASADYVSYAKQAGIDVWALVDNFDPNIDQMELLSHTSSREKLENNLIAQALQFHIDGINVDFEQIPTEAGEHYIQFIRELSVKCRLNDLVLSVDNYVPKGFNAHYQKKEQGIVADYVIIMGYDEHYSGSPEAGSVSSYDYVKEGIEETLKEVPAEKVISALPFYTRLWREVPKTDEELAEQEGSEAGNYTTKVSSEALGMQEAANRVAAAGAAVTWDDTLKQNYAEWAGSDGATYKIWMEDASSLEAKLQLMKDNQLAGTAAWKLGFETQDIWELILKYVN